ncbi:dehydrogenase [Opitutia bacterium ISCC 51]|nr:dehydrogenase [Opitutae bacterium ISCC 51]QXD30014.1 dehydrogenase [Opitutae bacterium ISCC 52]
MLTPNCFSPKYYSLGFVALALLSSQMLWAQVQPGHERREKEAAESGFSPEESHDYLTPAAGLEIDLVASEPNIKQPSFLRFDERGRMWMIEYRQYPHPAGLEVVATDEYWRNVYKKYPEPPGHPDFVPGADRITILEDSDGDGGFENNTTFIEGLNMVTGLAWDANGVWILQPPFLLFYEDKDHDDVVDGPPAVHLRGFGLEDSHSYANSLTWAPDGWLYGAQGSTVTAAITVDGSDAPPIKSVGQLMWRYHPKNHVYEKFAEGGGNIWSCQFDAKGRLFAGANEGGKLGYHYMQGAYNKKNFGKHGELSNPHTYGYFFGVEEAGSQRVTTNLMVYSDNALPDRYQNTIITANPLIGRVLASRPVSRGPTFHSELVDVMVDSEDRWFRPVYSESGPDGAVYVADWYDQQINHMENFVGRMSPSDGRVYRIRSEEGYKPAKLDLRTSSTLELVNLLKDPREWYRETARRLIYQRQDESVLPVLRDFLENENGQTALEALWAINLLGGFDKEIRKTALAHTHPHVRKWAVRLIGDEKTAEDWELSTMRDLAASDPNIEVRQQLSSTAKRLQINGSLSIVRELMKRDEDAEDAFMPLLVWWALEAFISNNPDQVVSLFEGGRLFDEAMVQNSTLEFIMRRLAAEGTRDYLRKCARLLKLAPDPESKRNLLAGFEQAYRGRSMVGLPDELLSAIATSGGGSLAMRIRQGMNSASEEAEQLLGNPSANEDDLQRVIEALGEVPSPPLLPSLLSQLNRNNDSIRIASLSALRAYNDPSVGESISHSYSGFEGEVQTAAQTLLMSRTSWAITWIRAVKQGSIARDLIPTDAVNGLRRLGDPALSSLVDEIWPEDKNSNEEGAEEMDRLRAILSQGKTPDRHKGRELYLARCGACHTLHNEGGAIGPELTGYQRSDLHSLLLAITNPNAEIREGYENHLVRTSDGQILSGFIVDRDEHVVVLRPVGGQPVVLEESRIESMEDVGFSLMPSGLLMGMDEQSIVDIFSYIQAPQPLNLRK